MAAPSHTQVPPSKVLQVNPGNRDANAVLRGEPLTLNTDTNGRRLSDQSFTQGRPNRYSTQTDARTIDTDSPFGSPTASTFRADGLAPRPPSFGYYEGDYSQDFSDRRRRRKSHNRDQSLNDIPPPAAPDAPRPGPPISYKMPFANSGSIGYLPGGPPRSARKPEGPISPLDSRGEYYREEEVDPRSSNGGDYKGKGVEGRSERDRDGRERAGSESYSRKGSLSEAEAQRRREWAPDKSPLQRLERTLDSITKEEKRARVEEAELAAREAKAGRGGDRARQNSVRFRNRPVGRGPDTNSQPEPQTLPDAGLVRSLSNKQKDQLQRSSTVERQRPTPTDVPAAGDASRGFEYLPQHGNVRQRPQPSAVPQSGPGTRSAGTAALGLVGAAGLAATALSRSGSNKLRKDPPGDLVSGRRQVPEQSYQQGATQRRPSDGPDSQWMGGRGVSPRGGNLDASRAKDLPQLPKGTDAADPEFSDDSDDDIDVGIARQRSNARKIEQLTGVKSLLDDRQVDSGDSVGAGRSNARKIEQLTGVKSLLDDRQVGTGDSVGVGRSNSRKIEQLTGVKSLLDDRQVGTGDSVGVGRSATLRQPGVPRLVSVEAARPVTSRPIADDRSALPGVYIASDRLDEWKKGGAVLLDGATLDLDAAESTDKDKTWWEEGAPTRRRKSAAKQRRAEAYDGEYADSNAPTRFKPPLYLKSGPLLRYCGLRRERRIGHFAPNVPRPERDIWRGSVMIVTEDSMSSYELAPTLRLFVQPIDLLPPPPAQFDGTGGELAPEYVDPIAGLPKIGRDGKTLYTRPVEHLQEMRDLSCDESDEGIFESQRSPLDGVTESNKPSTQKSLYDGENAGKYKEIRGFRLHAEHGVTFWKFNIEVELRAKQQRIAYRINRGPATGFWVPARDQGMNIMFHSCNGFSLGVDTNRFSGPDPMWRDVLNTHQTKPFHVMLGGGDQLYNDAVQDQSAMFKQWTEIRSFHHRERAPFTPELQEELELFYLNRYAMWFSQGLFGLAISQIPMINIYDDHDIIDGYGSYVDSYMKSPIMSGLGAVAFKYYMLFQHQTSIDEGEETEPTWILGAQPGPYIPELSRSIFTHLGRSIAFLGLDCRTERTFNEVVTPETYEKVFDRLEKGIIKGETKHLIVLLGIPIAYPRMVWLENILTSRLMDPVKALGRVGLLGKNFLNRFDGGVEILDDLDDHWTAKHHKSERQYLIRELQALAAEKSVRITILGGDVHLAAIGQFYSNPKLNIPRDRDYRYMPNIISSAIVNTPPPDTVADLLNRRNKTHHFDAETDEDMLPKFVHDVNGRPRNNKRLLNRRNWCSIRVYDPEAPPPPDGASLERNPSPPKRSGSLLRRLSVGRGPRLRTDGGNTDPSRPPLSSTNFFGRRSSSLRRPSIDSQNPGILTRTLSLSRKDFIPGTLFRRNSKKKSDSGGINGYGESDDDVEDPTAYPSGIRGGGTDEDVRNFSGSSRQLGHMPSYSVEVSSAGNSQAHISLPKGKLTRTPTSQTTNQRRRLEEDVNLDGALEISLNVEVNPKDPAGITTPYSLLVPKLWYEQEINQQTEAPQGTRARMKRWVSVSRKRDAPDDTARRPSASPSVEKAGPIATGNQISWIKMNHGPPVTRN